MDQFDRGTRILRAIHGRGTVTLFWASGDLRAYDLVEGWRVLVSRGIEVQEISGTHLNLIKQPHVAELTLKLNESLARAQGWYLRVNEPNTAAALSQPAPFCISSSEDIRKAS